MINSDVVTPTKPKPKLKREDLQVLRGGAILCVLAFHLRPDAFPNGYLGVDTFFVLSGYLITTMLDLSHKQGEASAATQESSECSCAKFILQSLSFYSRRVKRILPTYVLTLLWVLLAGGLAFGRLRSRAEQLECDTLWAAAFATNLKQLWATVSYGDMVGIWGLYS